MSLGVFWDGQQVGHLERVDDQSREYSFHYTDVSRAISLSLPTTKRSFTPAASRPFFEALLPEGAVREQIAEQLKLAASDSYGLLGELGRDCAGALQIVKDKRMSEPPSARPLDPAELDALIIDLPHRPLGLKAGDGRVRLSLAGVQRKAVLVRSAGGGFGEPLDGMPSTHILKPDPPESDYPGLAVNEFFCMRLAAGGGLPAARVELITAGGRPCLVVERFDRDHSSSPAGRLHQEDLCQALGLTPDFKYQKADWQLPSYRALAELLEENSLRPGADRLAAARTAVFHFLVGNADAHAKNVSLLHVPGGVRLSPLYDVVSTQAYPQLNDDLALSIGDELNPDAIALEHWSDLAHDFGLRATAFERVRVELAERVVDAATELRDEALTAGWHHEVVDTILEVISRRAEQTQ